MRVSILESVNGVGTSSWTTKCLKIFFYEGNFTWVCVLVQSMWVGLLKFYLSCHLFGFEVYDFDFVKRPNHLVYELLWSKGLCFIILEFCLFDVFYCLGELHQWNKFMILKTLKLLLVLELGEKYCVQDPFLILRVWKFLLQNYWSFVFGSLPWVWMKWTWIWKFSFDN